ncbi:MAG TPA: HDOD domain-containing protein [Nevskiaceae bacterium]|nr:HDOD domain-containing protein [Nevskiaceae bacterium]
MDNEFPIALGLIQQLSRAIADNALPLPAPPELATRLQELRKDPDLEPALLVHVIEHDMATSAELVRVANSAANRRGQVVGSVNAAVARLGTDLSLNLALSFSLEQLFRAHSPLVDQRLRRTWKRGQAVAAAATELACSHSHLNPELAMLAGLLHGIGKLPILKIVDSDARIASDARALDYFITALHPAAGCRVLQAWQFPAAITEIPTQCADLERSHAGDADYADVVTVALLKTSVPGEPLGSVDWANVPACRKLGVEPPTAKVA